MKTTKELLAEVEKITSNPENKAERGSLYLYTKNARRRLDKLYREIAANSRAERVERNRH